MKRNNLLNARNEKGITQKQIADKLGMEQTTYSKKERGVLPIKGDEWERFSKYLGVPIEEIKHEKVIPENPGFVSKIRFSSMKIISLPEGIMNLILKSNSKLEKKNRKLKRKIAKLKKGLKNNIRGIKE